MSPRLPRLRRSRPAALLVAAAVGATAFASPAAAATLDGTARCPFPTLGDQAFAFTVAFPDDLRGYDTTAPHTLTELRAPAALTAGGQRVDLLGGSGLDTKIHTSGHEPTSTGIPLLGDLPLPPEVTGGFQTFSAGTHSAWVSGLRLNVRVTDAAGRPVITAAPGTDNDDDPTTVRIVCTVDGKPTATLAVGPQLAWDRLAPSMPAAARAAVVTPTTAQLRWDAATDDTRVDHYSVLLTNTEDSADWQTRSVTSLASTFTGLRPDTTYTATIAAWDRGPNRSEPVVAEFRTPAATTTTKIATYDVSGGFAIAVEPTAAPGGPRKACVGRRPQLSFAGDGLNGVTLTLQGLWSTRYGVALPFPAGRTGTLRLRDGLRADGAAALRLVGAGGTLNRANLGTSGRVTIAASYLARRKVGGVTVTVPTALARKSVPYRFYDVAAGACDGQPDPITLAS